MEWLSLVVFIVLCYGFGYLLTFFAKNSTSFLERHLMRLGIGLGGTITLGYLLNLLNVPLDYRIFLGIMVFGLVIVFGYRHWKTKKLLANPLSFNINPYVIVMLILFGITFFMYHKGAFSYPYLENDDPWGHAVGTKYVAMEKTLFKPEGASIRYMDPYPPAYDMIMGILHQTNDSVMWTLKFFNVLFISLCIIFSFFFFRELTSNSKKALFGTFALFAMPAFLSHFIWAIALTMPLIFVSFYCLERIKKDKHWIAPSAAVITATLTVSPSHSAYFALLLSIYLGVKTICARRFLWQEYLGAILGALLSFALWWIPGIIRYGATGLIKGITGYEALPLSISGTGDRQYTLSDFVIAKSQNLINNPIGIGLALSLLLAIGLLILFFSYRKEMRNSLIIILSIFGAAFIGMFFFLWQTYLKIVPKRGLIFSAGSTPFPEFFFDQFFMIAILGISLLLFIALAISAWKNPEFKDRHLLLALGWLILSFYAVNASQFLYRLSPFRAWMILAIPVAILAAEAAFWLLGLAQSAGKGLLRSPALLTGASLLLLLLLGYGVVHTSFSQKYAVNTATWYPGGFWTSNDEIAGYLWMQSGLPPNAPIFTFSNDPLLLAFDKYSCSWCPEMKAYMKSGFNATAEENHAWLKENGYAYLLIDGQAAQYRGPNLTNTKIQGLISSGKFTPAFQNSGMILLSVLP